MKEQWTQPEGNTATMTAVLARRRLEHQEDGRFDDRFGSQTAAAQAVSHRRGSRHPHVVWPRVLVAEDDGRMRRVLARVLSAHGYAPIECRDGFELFERLEALTERGVLSDIEAIVSDILMPGPTGLDILEALHDRPGFPPMILITGSAQKGIHARAQRAGAAAVLQKPFGTDELLSKLQEIAPCHRGKECDI